PRLNTSLFTKRPSPWRHKPRSQPNLQQSLPTQLTELITLGRTLKRRALDVLAYFAHPGTSNGPTEAINGRLEHLRGTALGFRNLAHYGNLVLLDVGVFRTELHRHL